MIFPQKLKSGSHIRVIAPSRSFRLISQDCRQIALDRFKEMGITVSYSRNAEESNEFMSSSIKSRLQDLHEAFADKSVDAIFTAIGGFNSNELLDYIDYDLIKNNPKIFCGFSDITALSNAIYAKTGLITYSGPHFSSFGMLKGFDYTLEHFKKCFMQDKPFYIEPSQEWSNDAWFLDQEKREFIKNDGHWVINPGKEDTIKGTIIGGNLTLLGSLQGTPYFPDLSNSILFIEHCGEDNILDFNRNLQSLLQSPSFVVVKAVVIGRFEKNNKMTKEILTTMIKTKQKLDNIPVIANVDFGHSTPIISFPVGGAATLQKKDNTFSIEITKF